jgi:hypothetical protein
MIEPSKVYPTETSRWEREVRGKVTYEQFLEYLAGLV